MDEIKVICNLESGELEVLSDTEPFFCNITNTVRNLDNGWRRRDEIVYATPEGGKRNTYPINPQQFPRGNWNIIDVFHIRPENYKKESEYIEAVNLFGDVVIRTDAYRDTHVWSIIDGKYGHETPQIIRDSSFWIHCSIYKTSWGCIINPSKTNQKYLADICERYLFEVGPIPFSVT